MKKSNIIELVAKQQNVPVAEVEQEMRRAILVAFMSSGNTKEWREMFGSSRVPEPEEFIEVLANKVVA